MRVKRYDDGGEVDKEPDVNELLAHLASKDAYRPNGEDVEPLTNKEFRQNQRLQRKTERQHCPYQRADDTEELLGMLNNSEDVEERRLILRQLVRMGGLGLAGSVVQPVVSQLARNFGDYEPGQDLSSPWERLFPGLFSGE